MALFFTTKKIVKANVNYANTLIGKSLIHFSESVQFQETRLGMRKQYGLSGPAYNLFCFVLFVSACTMHLLRMNLTVVTERSLMVLLLFLSGLGGIKLN